MSSQLDFSSFLLSGYGLALRRVKLLSPLCRNDQGTVVQEQSLKSSTRFVKLVEVEFLTELRIRGEAYHNLPISQLPALFDASECADMLKKFAAYLSGTKLLNNDGGKRVGQELSDMEDLLRFRLSSITLDELTPLLLRQLLEN